MNKQREEEARKRDSDNNNTKMTLRSQGLLVDVRLAAGEINYLWDSINNSPKEDARKKLAGNINDFQHLDMFALVVNFIDILGHTRSESSVIQEMVPDEAAYRSAVISWMKNVWLLKVLKEISQWGHTVIITSDHGIIRVKKPVVVKGDKTTSAGIRAKYGRNLNLPSKQALVIKKPADFRLPNFDGVTNYLIASGDHFFVYPNQYHQFVKVFENSFQHGGISMDEMIIPIATLKGKNN